MQNMLPRRPRLLVKVLVVVLLGAAAGGISAIRRPILRAAGWALVVNERVEAADVVVLAYNADFAGMLEAADLVHSGVATRVAVFADPPDAVGLEFIRRGIAYEDAHDLFDNSRRSVSTPSSKSREMHAEPRT
jgi:hypothetical protein